MKLGRLATAVGIGAVTLAALAGPASAHTVNFSYGGGAGGVVGHTQVIVRDNECDGHSVWMEYDVGTIGGTVRYTLADPDGCGGSGAKRDHYPQQVLEARLCVAEEGCTAWVST